MGIRRHSIEDLRTGQVWYHYGWCYWYLIEELTDFDVGCTVYRKDGSTYTTYVMKSFLAYGGKLVFNGVRFHEKSLQVQDQAVSTPGQGPKETATAKAARGRCLRPYADGQDEDRHRLRVLSRVEGLDRSSSSRGAVVCLVGVEKTDPDTLTIWFRPVMEDRQL